MRHRDTIARMGWRYGVLAIVVALMLTGLVVLTAPDAKTALQGTVTAPDGPAADAVVRWQGATVSARSDVQGRFRIAHTSAPRQLTAALAGHPIAVGSARQPHLQLLPAPQDDNDDYLWIDPSPGPQRPLQCANCHGQIHEEWSRSAHAGSAKNGRFLHFFAGTDGSTAPSSVWNLLEEHPLGGGVCAACHAPTLKSPDLDYDIRQVRGVDRHGVHCDYCHKIAEAPIDKLGTRFGRDGYRLARPEGSAQLFFGPLDDAVRGGESFVYAPFYKESRYCASCHEGVIFGVHVYGTYTEWLASPARRDGQECQHCHMTPTGKLTNIAPGKGGVERDPHTLASHDFPGGTVEMLKRCLLVKASARRLGDAVVATVQTRAHQVGHRVPTGFIDRHLILSVEALDDHGQAVALRSGDVLPPRAGSGFAGRPGWIFGKQHLDAKGRPLPFWKTSHELLDTRLTPDQADERTFAFTGSAAVIRIRLAYRRFWPEVAAARAWSDNETLVWEQTINPSD